MRSRIQPDADQCARSCTRLLSRHQRKHRRRREAFDAADAELRQLISEGFDQGIPATSSPTRQGCHYCASIRSATGVVRAKTSQLPIPKPAPNYAHIRACSPTCLYVESR